MCILIVHINCVFYDAYLSSVVILCLRTVFSIGCRCAKLDIQSDGAIFMKGHGERTSLIR